MTGQDQIRKWWIYKITNPKGRLYVGITCNIKKRKQDYQYLEKNTQAVLFNSLKKYGFVGHSFDIIESFVSDSSFAYGKEMFWIRSYMSNGGKYPEQNGMNRTNGGEGQLGRVMSEETKEKLRQANLGKKYSEETKAKLSLMKKGKKIKSGWTEEKRLKMKEYKLNNPHRHTDEAKRKISESGIGNRYNVGRKQTKEHIEARAVVNRGNKYNLGRKASSSTLIKISENSKKPILQYSLDGVLLNQYTSVQEASEKTSISMFRIKQSGKGRGTTLKSFYFKYN